MNRRNGLILSSFRLHKIIATVAVTVLLINSLVLYSWTSPSSPLSHRFVLSDQNALLLVLVELALLSVAILVVLRRTALAAGPVYAIQRDLERLGAGELSARVSVRQCDPLKPEVAQINQSLDALVHRIERLQASQGPNETVDAA